MRDISGLQWAQIDSDHHVLRRGGREIAKLVRCGRVARKTPFWRVIHFSGAQSSPMTLAAAKTLAEGVAWQAI